MSLNFVTGKGGVGKTRTALLLAMRTKRAVLAELTPALADEAQKIGYTRPRIYTFSRADLAEEFLNSTLKIKALAQWLSQSSLFQTLLSLAPNLNELLLFTKWIEVSRKFPLVVDAPSTGHFLTSLDAIQTAKEIFDGGSLRKIADDIDEFLRSSEVTVSIVSIPERSALLEASEIERGIEARYPNFKIVRILNRRHHLPASATDLPSELRDFAQQRFSVEEQRLSGLSFDEIIPEGTVSL
jgi:anion-transporting  ArsA/GET3 family ATPase